VSGPANVLVLGGGGREHAIIHKLSQSKSIGSLHCAPGNPGIGRLATLHGVDPCDAEAARAICAKRDIDMVFVGPEAPLVAGVADSLRSSGVKVFGPGASGARLEGSKAFSKSFMKRHGIPTAAFDICSTIGECEAALASRKPPFVIKADGLAAGKGVFLPEGADDALAICRDLISGDLLGGAGRTLVIEDYMPGRELTVFALTDGRSFRLLPSSRDHKRVYDGDRGPNTGGMGAYGPVKLAGDIMKRVTESVLRPTLEGLASDGIDYRGVIYMGLMLSGDGNETKINVVEYNARLGDPETQAVLPITSGDFGLVVLAAAEGRLEDAPELGVEGSALCVVLASGGYPGHFTKGLPITGLEAGDESGAYVYHSGTAMDEGGAITTNGGRVLSVVGTGINFDEARARAYGRIDSIHFKDMHYRRDIGWSEQT
jgi:phosphoribosylamine--glycine ligase